MLKINIIFYTVYYHLMTVQRSAVGFGDLDIKWLDKRGFTENVYNYVYYP